MKATKAGQIIGYALEKADQKGKVLVHLQPGYYIPPKQLALVNEIDELKAQVTLRESPLRIAVQALEKRSEEQGKQLDALRAENADLKAQALKRTAPAEQEKERLAETVEVLKARLEKLERSVGSYTLTAKAE
jgi:hypothetical protein